MDELNKKRAEKGKALVSHFKCLGCEHEFSVPRRLDDNNTDPDGAQCPKCGHYKAVGNVLYCYVPGTIIWTCGNCDSTLMEITSSHNCLCVRCGAQWSMEERDQAPTVEE